MPEKACSQMPTQLFQQPTLIPILTSPSSGAASLVDRVASAGISAMIPSHGGKWDGPYRLLFCSSKGDKTGVIHEFKKCVNANLADYDKITTLHLASCEGCTEKLIYLLIMELM